MDTNKLVMLTMGMGNICLFALALAFHSTRSADVTLMLVWASAVSLMTLDAFALGFLLAREFYGWMTGSGQ